MSEAPPVNRKKFEEREETSDVEFSNDTDDQQTESRFTKKPSLPIPEVKKPR